MKIQEMIKLRLSKILKILSKKNKNLICSKKLLNLKFILKIKIKENYSVKAPIFFWKIYKNMINWIKSRWILSDFSRETTNSVKLSFKNKINAFKNNYSKIKKIIYFL
jgi:acetamidase/formamidase